MADPVLTFDEVAEIAAHSFTCIATMTSAGGHTIADYGFLYVEGTTGDPVYSQYVDNYVIDGGDPGPSPFEMTFDWERSSPMDQGTSYRVRPFVHFSDGDGGIAYGPTLTVETPNDPVDRYWVGGSGYFVQTAHWSDASGGTGGFSVPLRGDTAHFDENSGGATIQTYGGAARVDCLLIVDPDCTPVSFSFDAANCTLHGDLVNVDRFSWGNAARFISNGYNISAYQSLSLYTGYSEYPMGIWLGDSVLSVTPREGTEWSTCEIFVYRGGEPDLTAPVLDTENATLRYDSRNSPLDNALGLYGDFTFASVELFLAGDVKWTGLSLTTETLSIAGDGRIGFGGTDTNGDPYGTTALAILGHDGFTATGETKNGLVLDSWEGEVNEVPYKSAPWTLHADDGAMYVENCSLAHTVASGTATFWMGGGFTAGEGVVGWVEDPRGLPRLMMSLTPRAPAYNVYGIPTAETPMEGHAPWRRNEVDHPLDAVLRGIGPGYFPGLLPLREIEEAASMELTARDPAHKWAIPVSLSAKKRVCYRCYLIGADDDLDDLELPISSWQGRARDGEPSYLSVVVDNVTIYGPLIVARTNGDITLRKGYRYEDGSETTVEMMTVDYESIQVARGGRSESITLSGHRTVESTNPREVTVEGVSYYAESADGKRRVRCNMDLFLRCGDTCIYGQETSDQFIVGAITYWASASPFLESMEAVEA